MVKIFPKNSDNPHFLGIKFVMLTYLDSQITDNGIYYVLIDEVQMLDDFVGILNHLLHRNNVDVFVTGSNSKFLSKDVVTEFRGRGDEIHVYPFSFSEFYAAIGEVETAGGQVAMATSAPVKGIGGIGFCFHILYSLLNGFLIMKLVSVRQQQMPCMQHSASYLLFLSR